MKYKVFKKGDILNPSFYYNDNIKYVEFNTSVLMEINNDIHLYPVNYHKKEVPLLNIITVDKGAPCTFHAITKIVFYRYPKNYKE